MRVAIASDHAGFPLKEYIAAWLGSRENLTLEDLGPSGTDSVDYPDYAGSVCRRILEGSADIGILICNSGIGMSMSANRYRGIRAALCLYPGMAFWARHHNNANVIVLGGGITAPFLAREIVEVFLTESFDGGRHGRRVGKMDSLTGGNGS